MSEYLLRVATGAVALKILSIYSYYVESTAVSFEYSVPTEDEFRKRIEETLEKYPYIVCEYKDEVVGYAYAGMFRSRTAYQ